jgi:putative ABC transport system permease protein
MLIKRPGFTIVALITLALDMSKEARGSHYLRTVGRLKAGVTVAQAQADIGNIAEQLQKEYPNENSNTGAVVISLHDDLVKSVRPALLVLFGAVVLVLLIACANVANLLLVRTASRKREIAIRTALGASRWRLVRQLLTESLVLSLVGGGLGLLSSLWGTSFLDKISPGNIPRSKEITVDGKVLAFTFLAAVVSGLVFGLAPAIQASHPNLQETLKESGRGAAVGFRRQVLRNMLVVSEIAVALVLLIGAGLLMKSFMKLSDVDPGFHAEGVLTAQFTMSQPRYNDSRQRIALSRDVLQRLSRLPGVMSVGATTEVPFNGSWTTSSFSIVGRETGRDENLSAGDRRSLPGYFKTMGIPLLQGRDFNEGDGPDAPLVAIINHRFAERFFPNENPIGRHINFDLDDNSPGREIVGIVGDVKHESLDSNTPAEMYAPYAQDSGNRTLVAVLRTNDPKPMAAMIRDVFKAADPDQPVFNVRTMDDRLVASIRPQRFTMILLGIFAAIAMILAAVGIYGVMSYSVSQRTHEIGIRMALGAQSGKVLKLIIGQGMSLAIVGVILGIIGAFGLKSVMEGLLFGVSGTDRATFIGLSLLLSLVALLANYIPARRATRVDPMIAMRYE